MRVKPIERNSLIWDVPITNVQNNQVSTAMTNNLFSSKIHTNALDDVNKITKSAKEDKNKKLEFPEKILHKELQLNECLDRMAKPVLITSVSMFVFGAMLKAPLAMMFLGFGLSSVMIAGAYLIENFMHNRDVKTLKEIYNQLTDEQKKTLKEDIEEYPGNSSSKINYYINCAKKFLNENKSKILQKTSPDAAFKPATSDMSEIMFKVECGENN